MVATTIKFPSFLDFSELALQKYRIQVEVEWLIFSAMS